MNPWSEKLLCGILLLLAGVCVQAQPSSGSTEEPAQVVEFPADFFDRYRPDTALDMVRQIPGFQLDDGTDDRGFAAAVGNLLINGRRLSAKQDAPSAALGRIPAGQVERIQLIRGQVPGIDLQGQTVVANVIMKQQSTAAVRWQTYIEHNNTAPIKPAGSISLANTWQETEFLAGLDVERNTSGYEGVENEFDADWAQTVAGTESSKETGWSVNGISLNAARHFGATYTHMNAKFNGSDSRYRRPSAYHEIDTDIMRDVMIATDRSIRQYELGLDAEREFGEKLAAKLIVLLTNRSETSDSTRTNTSSTLGQTLLRIADTDTIRKERIARTEFDWVYSEQHQLQLNLELAYNLLDRTLLQTDDRGAGPVDIVVPGGNSRVTETRGDILVQDTWRRGIWELDYGIGMELASVDQTGDADQQRNFSFFKPNLTLVHAPARQSQSRFRLRREVSQLNLADFVSATVFEDNDLALGNPDIRPEKTWIAELDHERRFEGIGVIRLLGFYHRVTDVLDLLPVGTGFEAPGNIGNGRRYGASFEGTAPLEAFGLGGARLDITLRWQRSRVTDPVTGEERIMSGEDGQNAYRTLTSRNRNNRYYAAVTFRQDLDAARVAWGWTVAERAIRPLYKVNELDIYKENVAMDAFIETTRWANVKVRLEAMNLNDDAQERDRTLYTGLRGITPVDHYLLNDRRIGRRLVLSVSGSF